MILGALEVLGPDAGAEQSDCAPADHGVGGLRSREQMHKRAIHGNIADVPAVVLAVDIEADRDAREERPRFRHPLVPDLPEDDAHKEGKEDGVEVCKSIWCLLCNPATPVAWCIDKIEEITIGDHEAGILISILIS